MNEYKNWKVEIRIKLVNKKVFLCLKITRFIFKAELQKALTYAEEQMEHAKVIEIFHKFMKISVGLFS
jgi:hypothetical protein